MGRTLFDKLWDEHSVADLVDGASLIYIDRIFLHELEAIQIALTSGDLQAVADIQRAHISMSFNRLMQQKE